MCDIAMKPCNDDDDLAMPAGDPEDSDGDAVQGARGRLVREDCSAGGQIESRALRRTEHSIAGVRLLARCGVVKA